MSPADLIEHWRFRNHRMQIAHYESARYYARLHLLLGIPAIALSAAAGTTVFTTIVPRGLSSSSAMAAEMLAPILVALFSVLAAVLTGLQTFLKNAEQAEKHRLVAAKFANLKHRIELLATIPPATTAELKIEFADIESIWSKLREESPTLPTRIWRRIESNLTFEEHRSRYPSLLTTLPPNGP